MEIKCKNEEQFNILPQKVINFASKIWINGEIIKDRENPILDCNKLNIFNELPSIEDEIEIDLSLMNLDELKR